jgi:non-ribosomal peptide synthase protein (TIGR01720 family)
MESHGRWEEDEDLDVNRTVGWFTSLYPVNFQLANGSDIQRTLIDVKNTLHRVPNLGTGYGILRYLAGHAELEYQPEICYNNLGQFSIGDQTGIFMPAGESPGPVTDPNLIRRTLLDLTILIIRGQLQVQLSYSKNQFRQSTMTKVLSGVKDYVERIAAICCKVEENIRTSSDFDYKLLGEDDLDNLFQFTGK